jgi:hypothetical protein
MADVMKVEVCNTCFFESCPPSFLDVNLAKDRFTGKNEGLKRVSFLIETL